MNKQYAKVTSAIANQKHRIHCESEGREAIQEIPAPKISELQPAESHYFFNKCSFSHLEISYTDFLTSLYKSFMIERKEKSDAKGIVPFSDEFYDTVFSQDYYDKCIPFNEDVNDRIKLIRDASKKFVAGVAKEADALLLHQQWIDLRKMYRENDLSTDDVELKHPLDDLIDNWVYNRDIVPITPEHDQSFFYSTISHEMGSVRAIGLQNVKSAAAAGVSIMPELGVPGRTLDLCRQKLHKVWEVADISPAWLITLNVFNEDLVRTRQKSKDVAIELKILFEALISLTGNQYERKLEYKFGDLMDNLYADYYVDREKKKVDRNKYQKYHRTQVIQGLYRLNTEAVVPYIDYRGELMGWRPVLWRNSFNSDAKPDTKIHLSIDLLPEMGNGYMILKDQHRDSIRRSKASFCAFHTSHQMFDIYGRKGSKSIWPTRFKQNAIGEFIDKAGAVITTDAGTPITQWNQKTQRRILTYGAQEMNPDRESYKKFTYDQLANICYPRSYGTKSKEARWQLAKAEWLWLEEKGMITIEKLPAEGSWRIMPGKRLLKTRSEIISEKENKNKVARNRRFGKTQTEK